MHRCPLRTAGILACALLSASTAFAVEPTSFPTSSATTTSATGTLQSAKSTTEMSGTYTSSASDTATFRSVDKGNKLVDVSVDLHGMTLKATIDFTNKTASFSGYATATTTATTLRAEDNTLLASFSKKLQSTFNEATATLAEKALVKAAGVWEEWPTDSSLSQTITADAFASIYTMCAQAQCPVRNSSGALVMSYTGPCAQWNWTGFAEHDCNQCNFGDPNCQQIVQLGDHHRCNGDEWYWTGSSWACGEPNHWIQPYVTGNCFGRCGGGCGFGWPRQYTLNCMDHDGCVRNGHSLLSWWCNDQFVAAIDDQLFAPNCY